MTRSTRGTGRTSAIVAVALAVLLTIPLPGPEVGSRPASSQPFIWARDSFWQGLEATFVAARADSCADSTATRNALEALERDVVGIGEQGHRATNAALESLEAALFRVAPRIAACPGSAARFVALQSRLRSAVKELSREWDLADRGHRDRLYRLLYGSRAAIEEVVLQQDADLPMLVPGTDEPSAVPGAVVRGVMVRSGDMLVSRGGYPTSALIARGSDHPGNFSHVALAHVDETSGAVSVIEAHIEAGVAISSADAYLADKKLRLMVLRLRADLPAVVADPLLPHRAASAMLERARAEHIPYDFAMDYRDPSRLFCSEVASAAYRGEGIELWTGISTISSEGLRAWLASFGVSHFETQEPSDLEYDPQLVVVAEWRDAATLFRDHLDNAVTDAMLEGAERGDRLGFAWYQLPLARVAKGYSWVKERFGGIGPIPEGMSAAAALRNTAYSARHAALARRVEQMAEEWSARQGYSPPYWALVALARQAVVRSGE